MANCITCAAICERAGQHHVKTDCASYVPKVYPKPRTNYDRIVSKSPYDLAEFLGQIMDCCWNAGSWGRGECDEDCPMYNCCNNQSSDNIEDWLKQEVQG